MDAPATAIIMASSTSMGNAAGTAMHGIAHMLTQCADAGLDVMVVAPQSVLNAWHDWSQAVSLTVTALPPCSPQQFVSSALRAGVQMSARSSGWLLLPADMVMLNTSTLPMLCAELKQHLIVHATDGGQPRLPVGFGQELFSELIHLDSDHALHRLMNRYPTQAVEVNDPGVLMRPWQATEVPSTGFPSLLRHKTT